MSVAIPTWTDRKRRKWRLAITVGHVRTARELAGVDLLSILGGRLLTDLLEDPLLLPEVLWVVCRQQADAELMSKHDFQRLVEVTEDSISEFLHGFVSKFFPEVTKRRPTSELPEEQPVAKDKLTADTAWQNIHEMAGTACVIPDPFSWRELSWMATGRRRLEWRQTSYLLTISANANRDKKKSPRPFHPDDFIPEDLREGIRKLSGIRLTPQNLHILKPMFTNK